MNTQTVAALFEAKSSLLDAWKADSDKKLQTEIFLTLESINSILRKRGIDARAWELHYHGV